MKTLKLTNVKVIEVILRPNEETPLAVLFEVHDEAGQAVMTKRVVVKNEDMPLAATTAIASLVSRITARLISLEQI